MSDVTREQIEEFVLSIRRGRIDYDCLRLFFNTYPEIQAEKLDEFLATPYMVTVNYNEPVGEMILAGRYDDWEDCVWGINGCDIVTRRAVVLKLRDQISAKDAIAQIEDQGLRPARTEELFAFGATYPIAQTEYDILALGSWYLDEEKHRRFPYLGRRGDKRYIWTMKEEVGWYKPLRFLAVSKKVESSTKITARVRDKYRVVVDDSKSFRQLVAEGGYWNSEIVLDRCKYGCYNEDTAFGMDAGQDVFVSEVELVLHKKSVDYKTLIAFLDSAGFRMATYKELLVFGSAHKKHVLDLGVTIATIDKFAIGKTTSEFYTVELRLDDGRIGVGLDKAEGCYFGGEYTLFLVVRKSERLGWLLRDTL